MIRLREVNVFAVVGVVATAVHVAVGLAAAKALDVPPLVANTIAFFAALAVSYLGNTKLTFRVPALRWRAAFRYAVLTGAGFALNQAIVAIVVYRLGWDYAVALAIVVVTIPPLTFMVAKYWALEPR